MKKNQLKMINDFDQQLNLLLKNKTAYNALYNSMLQLHKDLNAYKSFQNSKEKSLKKVSDLSSLTKLQVGGGSHYLHNFINLDLFQPADIIWDCRYGLPFPNGRFDYIFSEHFLEHIDFPDSALFILKEFYRTLKKGSSLFISIPDGGKVINAYAKNNKRFLNRLYKVCYSRRNPKVQIYSNIDYINYLFRDQINNPKYTVHHWAYDNNSLIGLLKAAGFKKVQKTSINTDFCNKKREFYSLYILATK